MKSSSEVTRETKSTLLNVLCNDVMQTDVEELKKNFIGSVYDADSEDEREVGTCILVHTKHGSMMVHYINDEDGTERVVYTAMRLQNESLPITVTTNCLLKPIVSVTITDGNRYVSTGDVTTRKSEIYAVTKKLKNILKEARGLL